MNTLKFFIVDDDPFFRMLYHQHLMNLGFKNNILFDNGYDCIKKLDLHPDVIFLDYNMKPYNGLEVLQKIRQFNPNIHMFIISSQVDQELADAAGKYGVSCIAKGERDLETISKEINKIALKK
jgi:CheY-like chemotaxis protein